MYLYLCAAQQNVRIQLMCVQKFILSLRAIGFKIFTSVLLLILLRYNYLKYGSSFPSHTHTSHQLFNLAKIQRKCQNDQTSVGTGEMHIFCTITNFHFKLHYLTHASPKNYYYKLCTQCGIGRVRKTDTFHVEICRIAIVI